MTKYQLKHLSWVRNLPYPELLEAHKIIERGADVALLYFWFNLTHGMYWPTFKLIDVEAQAMYYCQRDPMFMDDIVKWFQVYEGIAKIKEENDKQNRL